MKTIKSFILIPLIAAFLCACGASGGGTNVSVSDVGNVEGTVTDASTGTALSGVTVQIGDKTATTGDNGVFSIQDLDVGSRTVSATKTGYQSYSGTVTITKGTTVSHNIEMTATGTTPDTTPPTVSSTGPANNATGVAVNQAITVTFSEAMDCSTITTSSFTLKDSLNTAVAGTITTCNNTSAVFTPSSNLSYSTSYTATITSGVKDAAGNAMASNYSWSFTTGDQPTTAPSSPTGVSATAGDGQVVINWDLAADATSYNIYWSTSSGVTTSSSVITGATRPYTHAGRTNGVTYYYAITAANSAGESSLSSEVSATPQTAVASAGKWDEMVWDTGVWGD